MFSFATTTRADDGLRYLALGDSYSIGEGVPEIPFRKSVNELLLSAPPTENALLAAQIR